MFLYNTSEYAMAPWIRCGLFTCIAVDIQNVTHWDKTRDVLWLGWDVKATQARLRSMNPAMVISFPPCTDLTVAGARHWEAKREANPLFQYDAVNLATIGTEWGCPYVVENPVGALSTLWRPPEYYWHPCDYGEYLPVGDVHPEAPDLYPSRDAYRKRTGSWLGNGAVRPTMRPVLPESLNNPGWEKLGGKSARTKYLRSLTPRGWAEAFFLANWEKVVAEGEKVCDTVPTQYEMEL